MIIGWGKYSKLEGRKSIFVGDYDGPVNLSPRVVEHRYAFVSLEDAVIVALMALIIAKSSKGLDTKWK